MSDNAFRCVMCGFPISELYKDYYKTGVIRIEICKHCDSPADRYIEFDAVITFLDVLLHRYPAYCHIMFNMKIRWIWRILLLFLLCDTLLKWDVLNRQRLHDTDNEVDDHLFYAALELIFYQMFALSVLEWCVYSATVGLLLTAHQRIVRKTLDSRWYHDLLTALSLSGFGKLLAIPAIVWGQSDSAVYLSLARLFFITSNITGCRALIGRRQWLVAIIVILAAHGLQSVVGSAALHYLVS